MNVHSLRIDKNKSINSETYTDRYQETIIQRLETVVSYYPDIKKKQVTRDIA